MREHGWFVLLHFWFILMHFWDVLMRRIVILIRIFGILVHFNRILNCQTRCGSGHLLSRIQGNCLRSSCINAFAWWYRITSFSFRRVSLFHLHIAGGLLINR